MLKALVEMSSAYCRVEINSFITLCSYHYHHRMAFLQGIDGPSITYMHPRTYTITSHTHTGEVIVK